MCDRDRLNELISGKLDGVLDPDGDAALMSLLAGDPEARARYELLAAAHKALDFEAEPPAELLSNVMEGVERENRARRSASARLVRLFAGFAAAAAVLAAVILPNVRGSEKADESVGPFDGFSAAPNAGCSPDGFGSVQDSSPCYNPEGLDKDNPIFHPPEVPDGHFTAEDFCVDYYAVLYFNKLPEALRGSDPVIFSDGSAGYVITAEQFGQYKADADRITYPDPDGTLIMVVETVG